MSGRHLQAFGIPFDLPANQNNSEIIKETSYDLRKLELIIRECVPKLTPEQNNFRNIFSII